MSNTKSRDLSLYDEELGQLQKEQRNEQTWDFVKQSRGEVDRTFEELKNAIKQYTEAHWEINWGKYNIDELYEIVMVKATCWRTAKMEWKQKNDWYFENCL